MSLLTGSLGVLLLTPDVADAGASGAVYGLLGAAIVMARNRNIDLMQSGLLPILGLNFVLHVLRRSISIGGHIGGLIGGLVVTYVVEELAQRRRKSTSLAVAFCAVLGVASAWPRSLVSTISSVADAARRRRDAVRVQRVGEPLQAVHEARAGAGEPGGRVGDDDPVGAERVELRAVGLGLLRTALDVVAARRDDHHLRPRGGDLLPRALL